MRNSKKMRYFLVFSSLLLSKSLSCVDFSSFDHIFSLTECMSYVFQVLALQSIFETDFIPVDDVEGRPSAFMVRFLSTHIRSIDKLRSWWGLFGVDIV